MVDHGGQLPARELQREELVEETEGGGHDPPGSHSSHLTREGGREGEREGGRERKGGIEGKVCCVIHSHPVCVQASHTHTHAQKQKNTRALSTSELPIGTTLSLPRSSVCVRVREEATTLAMLGQATCGAALEGRGEREREIRELS